MRVLHKFPRLLICEEAVRKLSSSKWQPRHPTIETTKLEFSPVQLLRSGDFSILNGSIKVNGEQAGSPGLASGSGAESSPAAKRERPRGGAERPPGLARSETLDDPMRRVNVQIRAA